MQDEPEKKKQSKVKIKTYLISLFIVAAVSIGGTYMLTNQSNQDIPVKKQDDTQSGKLSKVEAVYDQLLSQYFKDVDGDMLIEGALTGMVDAIGDPYTQYLDVSEATSLNNTISASFEGIGAEVMKQGDSIMIVSPIAGSPAEKAGLKPNDILLKADDKDLTGLSLNEAVSFIRGEKGSKVVLTIRRGETQFEVSVTRDTIPVETVVYNLDKEHPTIGYISINSFSNPTYDELVTAVKELRTQGAKSFIFDVRQNPGGILDGALNISNMFVEEGSIIMQTQEKDQEPVKLTADKETMGEFKVTEPSVLLVDEGSASASEILAGALKEAADIPIIGTKTFGKGTVQTVASFSDNSELKLTIAKWLTPSGKWINEKGIEPTIPVELPDYTKLLIIDSTKEYQLGDVSDEVENLEKVFEALDYETGPVDGYLDEQTVSTIKEFQTEQKLETTGVVTGDTAAAMIEDLRTLIKDNDTQYEKGLDYLKE
ncbi:S41 family peptidase [Carnobacterium funditum]|uniref:S41 family peptidase n=1 Tax=Carnobacterium funditum TaxID=2752 RepID=UPI00054FAEF3|nr:S41 family peptidase [Carnobacterium funditum]